MTPAKDRADVPAHDGARGYECDSGDRARTTAAFRPQL
jgi:hypothetical protein